MAPAPRFDRAAVREMVERLGVRPRRGLGQHFLADPALLAEMTEAMNLDPNDRVVEIGAGFGQWTAELCRRAREVVAIEIDPVVAAAARENLSVFPNVRVVVADGANWLGAISPCGDPPVVCSNLPYAVYRRILLACLTAPVPVRAFFFTIQREVFHKLTAPAGDALYNALGAVLSFYCTFRRLRAIPCSAFYPEPQVESVFFRVDRAAPPPEDLPAVLCEAESLFCWKKKVARRAIATRLGAGVAAQAEREFGGRTAARLRDWPAADVVALARWSLRRRARAAGSSPL